MNIVVLDGFLISAGGLSWKPIEKLGNLTVYEDTPPDLAAKRIGNADIVLTNRCPVDADVIGQCGRLKMIHSFGTGYNQIDIKEADARGICVCNTPGYGKGAVAQMTIALLMQIVRNTALFDARIKQTGWNDTNDPYLAGVPQFDLSGKTIGIIGLGNIGYAVAKIALAMDMKVLAYCRTPDYSLECGNLHFTDLDTLLENSDIISLHCPLTESTRGMICKKSIDKMKRGAILLNTSRGALVCEEDVAAALDTGRLYAAGVDVFAKEPCGKNNPLAMHPRCVATPHAAWMPMETRKGVIDTAAKNISAFMQGRPVNTVNGK